MFGRFSDDALKGKPFSTKSRQKKSTEKTAFPCFRMYEKWSTRFRMVSSTPWVPCPLPAGRYSRLKKAAFQHESQKCFCSYHVFRELLALNLPVAQYKNDLRRMLQKLTFWRESLRNTLNHDLWGKFKRYRSLPYRTSPCSVHNLAQCTFLFWHWSRCR